MSVSSYSFVPIQVSLVHCYDAVTEYLEERPLIAGAAVAINIGAFIYKESTGTLSLECCNNFYNPLLQVLAVRIGTSLLIERFRKNTCSIDNNTYLSQIVNANEIAATVFSSVFVSKSIVPYLFSCSNSPLKVSSALAQVSNESLSFFYESSLVLRFERCQDWLLSFFLELKQQDQLFIVIILPMILTCLVALTLNIYHSR